MLGMFFYFFIMFFMFLMSLCVSLSLYYLDMSVLFEWLIFNFNSLNLEMMVLVDWVSLMFISVIFLISSMIMLYSVEYMRGNLYVERFVWLVLLFILSMMLMILSPNILSILFGWDGLGLTSYCLVIFYQNYMSYNSGMVTVLCNRIGDVGLLLGVGLMSIFGSWNYWEVDNSGGSGIGVFMLVLAAVTKSAQLPFSVWLPMAMAAPTPVSALVHSSTLVTAGVYLMIRFNDLLMGSVGANKSLFFVSVLTMFMAGLMANVEYDLKKIIALSTLSQLGLMMMILSVGQSMVAFYHLMTHAIFKSLLFMCAGVLIHLMFNNQDIRSAGGLNELIPFTMMSFYLSSMALCGAPFLAGFYSKDYIMELIYSSSINIFLCGLIISSLLFTVSYTVRLFYYLFFSKMKFVPSYMILSEVSLMNFSMMILVMFSIIIGSLLNWMFFFDNYFIYISLGIKLITLFMCITGVGLGVVFLFNIMKHFYFFNFYLSGMFNLSSLYCWIYVPINIVGVGLSILDKTWIEFSFKNLFNYLVSNFKFIFFYKIFMFMNFTVCVFVVLIMLA